MSLTARDIAQIAQLLDASHFTELDLQQGSFRLRIRRAGASPAGAAGGPGQDEDDAEAPPPQPAPRAAPSPALPRQAGAGRAAPAPGEVDILSPLPGNFYTAPRPGEPPFVKPGDPVTPQTVVAIIEVMKLMNPVLAGVSGVIAQVLAENGTAIVASQPLFRVRQG